MDNLEQNKELVIEQLKKIPIVQIACEKAGVARASFYRWKASDPEFAKKVDEAVADGKLMVNDLAEVGLINLIKEKNLGAISQWLKVHHPDYRNKIEISGKIETDQELTAEQAQTIKRALELASFGNTPNHETMQNENK